MSSEKNSLQNSIFTGALFTLVLWWIKLCEFFFGWSLASLGVYPLSLPGLAGIVFAPLIHGSWQHLISNTLPVLILTSTLWYGYPKSRVRVFLLVWLMSGLAVWCLGRPSYHIGASGLAHGMFFYLFVAGILRRDKRSVALLMLAFYMYGGMLFTIFPQAREISFEYHFFGALSGALCAIAFRALDPKWVDKRYDWQDEDEDHPAAEDDLIGDLWQQGNETAQDDREDAQLHTRRQETNDENGGQEPREK
ncbi:rhomboid family intramembrane serine protease [Thalassomonas viridans]|uniref:Rhomboid family intramembrane serine protease n=1 Tax=Thalassomonas viridans TaxID=137584 RepID=A0AAE9Z9H3_9GAMM|nr:rhomboid family intramembrane serine protease [Thalassomonas viridans]WDE07562.1 rhomboid family intramembrane serine protease [Thalassomonas viridans]